MTRRAVLTDHAQRLVAVVRNAHLKRALASVDPQPSLHFWCITYGNLLDVSVLEWCKVFGTNAEPTHWRRVIKDKNHDAFRKGLLVALGITSAEWIAYWKEMKNYRDKLAAHYIDDGTVHAYPNLTLAITSSCFYYAHLIKELRALGEKRFPEDLSTYGARFEAQAKDIAKTALAATSVHKEQVF
jgi:hypothetical protein